MYGLCDRKFRVPRIWSNGELRKFAHLFRGRVVNVSGWKDIDKEGAHYRDYFSNSSEYWITNYISNARGYQGDLHNEIFLDLTKELPEDLFEKFDVVFSHTVLEHIYDFRLSFQNLSNMTSDIVIIVVPFLQEQHADYGDYWRFTPQALDKMFHSEGLSTIYVNFNDHADASIYIFAIGSKNPALWRAEIGAHPDNRIGAIYALDGFAGRRVIRNSLAFRIFHRVHGIFRG